MRIENLTASDFPGIDEAKFNEWKALKLKDNRRKRIASYLSFPIALILFLIAKSNVWTWQKRGEVPWDMAYWILVSICFVIYMAYVDITTKPLQRLGKDLKMSARLRAKKKGQQGQMI